jgi:transcriptional regulator with XRE-family HTH domain
MSKAVEGRFSYARFMATSNEEALFNEALCARTHELRNERGWTSLQMATALNVPPDRYRKYEYRSPLPAYLMERFALIVGCDLDYLLTGRTTRATKAVDNREKLRA